MKLTLGTTYYNNPDNIKTFINNHLSFVDELVIVDDGSEIYPLTDYVEPSDKIRIFRVLKDYGFNSHGCRNLIVKQSTNDWIILLDSDRIFIDAETAIFNLTRLELKENTLYRFVAHSYREGNHLHVSVNDYLIHRSHFFSVGGYDEELIGYRSGDRSFFKQLEHTGDEYPVHGSDILLTRKSTVALPDKDIMKSKNDVSSISKEIRNLIDARIKKPDANKPILTFEWEEITCK